MVRRTVSPYRSDTSRRARLQARGTPAHSRMQSSADWLCQPPVLASPRERGVVLQSCLWFRPQSCHSPPNGCSFGSQTAGTLTGLTELSDSLRHLCLFRSDRLVDARIRQELVHQSQESVPIRGIRKQNWECLERLFGFMSANDFLLADIELPLPRCPGRQELHVLLQDLLHKFHAFQGQRNFLPVQQKSGARHGCGIPAFGYGPQSIL